MANWYREYLEEHPELEGLQEYKRSANSIHFRRADNQIEAHFTGKPAFYQDEQQRWQPIDTELRDDGDVWSAPGVPVRIRKATGRVEIDGVAYQQRTLRVGLYRPATGQFTGYWQFPVGDAQGDCLVRENAFFEHRIYLLVDGIRETLTIKKKPPGFKGKKQRFGIETLVEGVTFADGELAEYALEGYQFHLPTATDGDDQLIACTRYARQVDGRQYVYTVIDSESLANAVYPIVIDPDFSATTADNYIRSLNSNYSIAWTTSYANYNGYNYLTLGQAYLSGDYSLYRGCLLFDTSSIPTTATITQVNLKATIYTDYYNPEVDSDILIKKYDWSNYNPVTSSNRQTVYVGVLNAVEDDGILCDTSTIAQDTQVTSGNLDTAWVNKDGYTYYGLISSLDQSGTEPSTDAGSDDERIRIYAHETVTSAYRPVLTVAYYLTLEQESGSYALTGSSADLVFTRYLSAGAGSYTLSGGTTASVTTLGTAQDKATATSLVSSGTFTPAVDDYVMAVVAADSDVVGTLSLTSNEALYDSTTQSITVTNPGYVAVALNIARITAIPDRVWSTSNNLNTGRMYLSGAGTQTAGISVGGYTTAASAVTEEYDGASWTAGGNLNTARDYLACCGTQTAGLSFGGRNSSFDNSAVTEEYDGSAWTSGGNLNTARRELSGCGTQTSGLSFGGRTTNFNTLATTEEYDGAAWAASGDLSVVRRNHGGCGTQAAGLSFCGLDNDGNRLLASEEYDGSNWATVNDSSGSSNLAGFGLQASAVNSGGSRADSNNKTEEYDGTTWTQSGNLNTARYGLAGCGLQSAGLSFGGFNQLTVTEEYNANTYSASTITFSGLSAEAHAAAFYVAKGLDTTSPYDKGASATGNSTTPSSGTTATLAQANSLVIGGIGTEGPSGDTAGTWTTGDGYVSGNEQRLGTTGSTDNTNITVSAAAEIVSATTAQTAAKTGITSRRWAALVAVFKVEQSAVPTATKQITADSASYTITGTDASLSGGIYLSAESGSYTYSGEDAALSYGASKTLTADAGSYTYTGAVADLQLAGIFDVDAGAYTYSGQSVAFYRQLYLSAAAGTYAITGSDAYPGPVTDQPPIYVSRTYTCLFSGTVNSAVLRYATDDYYDGSNWYSAKITDWPNPGDMAGDEYAILEANSVTVSLEDTDYALQIYDDYWLGVTFTLQLITTRYYNYGNPTQISFTRQMICRGWGREPGAVRLELVDVLEEQLEKLYPEHKYDAEGTPQTFPDILDTDIDKPIPVVVGFGLKCPCVLLDTDPWIYGVCEITSGKTLANYTINAVYRGGNEGGALVSTSEYTKTSYAGDGVTLVALSFSEEQRDFNGEFYSIFADVINTATSANAATEARRLLSWVGLTTDATSWNIAASYASQQRMYVDWCYGRDGNQTNVRVLIDQLLFVLRGRIYRGSDGEYEIWQDKVKASSATYYADSDEIEFGNYQRTALPAKIELSYCPSNAEPGTLKHTLTRTISGGIGDVKHESWFIRSFTAADYLHSYLHQRAQYNRTATATIHNVQHNLGDVIAVTSCEHLYGGSKNWIIRGIQREADANVVDLLEYDATVYSYVPGPEPKDGADPYAIDYSQTIPEAPTNFAVTASGVEGGAPSHVAYATVRCTPPAVNWAKIYFACDDGTGLIQGVESGGYYVATIRNLIPGKAYTLLAWAENQWGLSGLATAAELPHNAVPDSTAPNTPSGLAATQGTGKAIQIKWNAVTASDLKEYELQRKTGIGGTYATIYQGLATAKTDTDVNYGTAYYYRVRAKDYSLNVSAYSNEVNITPININETEIDTTIPLAPTGFALYGSPNAGVEEINAGVYQSWVNLTCIPPAERCKKLYFDAILQTGEPTGGASIRAQASLSGGNYIGTLRGMVPGRAYTLRAYAESAFGISGLRGSAGTNYATLLHTATPDTTSPTTPTNIYVTQGTGKQIRISWSSVTANDLAFYVIDRNVAGGGWSEYWKGKTTSFSDNSVDYNITYYYRVKAVDYSNNSSGYVTHVGLTLSTIPGGDITDNTIPNAKIINIVADKITAGTLNCALITVTNLNASSITTGTLSGDRISGGTITGSTIQTAASGKRIVMSVATNELRAYDASGNERGSLGVNTTDFTILKLGATTSCDLYAVYADNNSATRPTINVKNSGSGQAGAFTSGSTGSHTLSIQNTTGPAISCSAASGYNALYAVAGNITLNGSGRFYIGSTRYFSDNGSRLVANGDLITTGSFFPSNQTTRYFWSDGTYLRTSHDFVVNGAVFPSNQTTSSWAISSGHMFTQAIIRSASDIRAGSGLMCSGRTDAYFYTANRSITTDGGVLISEPFIQCNYSLSANRYLHIGLPGKAGSAALYMNSENVATIFSSSDLRLKEKISPVHDIVSKLKCLDIIHFEWKDKHKEGQQIGFSAQSFLGIFPSLVGKDCTGMYGLDPVGLIPAVVAGIQELAERIEDIEKQLRML